MLNFPFFPHTAPHKLVTDMCNSAQEIIALTDGRNGELRALHSYRVYELMRHRSHNPEY